MRRSASENPRTRSRRVACLAERCEPRYLLSAIGSDQTVTGTIASATQVDSYTFDASAGQSVWAAAGDTAAGSVLRINLALQAPDGTLVTQAAGIPGTNVYATNLTQTGTYTLKVSGANGTLGDYAMTLALPGVAPVSGTDAGPIDSGAYHTASIGAGDLDVYTISGTQGGSLLAAIGKLDSTAAFRPQIIVFSPSGAPLANVTNSIGTNTLVQNLPATGTYYVVAGDQFSNQTGDYAITVATFAGPQISDADSGPISSGQHVTGTIGVGDFDVYTINASSGGSLLAAIGNTDANSPMHPQMMVFSPSGALLADVANAVGTNTLVQNLPATGTYAIVAIDQFSNNTGHYALSVARFGGSQTVSPGEEGGPIASGAYVTGTISLGDFDIYTLSGTSGGSLLTTIGNIDAASTAHPQMLIFSPSGQLLGNVAGATGVNDLEQNLAETGTYSVVALVQFSNQTGRYALSAAAFAGPQITDSDSGPISSGQRVTGTIDLGDFDIYTISANVGGSLLAAIGNTDSSSSAHPQILVFSPSGTLLANVAAATGTNTLVQNLPATGTYAVVALVQFGNQAAHYALSVARFGGSQTVSAGDEGGPLASGEYRTGSVSPGDFDVYTISASVGQTLVAALGGLDNPPPMHSQLMVFSPTGALLDNQASLNGASTLLTDLTTAGSYAIVALGQFGNTGGGYGLTVVEAGGSATQTVSPGHQGGPLTSGQRTLGKIAPGDIDAFSFNLAPGNGAFWTVGKTVNNSFAPRLIVLDPNGTVLSNATNAQGTATSLAGAGATAAGTYLALVMDGTGGKPGEYALTGVAVPAAQAPDDDGGALAPGQPRAGALPPGDADVYTVSATAGQKFTINLAKTGTTTFTPGLIVYGAGGNIVGSNAGATTSVVITSATAGTYTIVVADRFGTGSGAYSIGLNTPTGADNYPPKLLAAEFRYNDRPLTLRLAFSENVSASFQTSAFVLRNLTTGQTIDPASLAITFSAVTNEIYFGFTPLTGGVLPDGNYHLSIPAASLTDEAGNPLTSDVSLDFYVLAGDANRDRTVSFSDLLIIAQNYGQPGKSFSQGDFNYDGTVNFSDLLILAQNYGKSLPAPAAATPAAAAAFSPVPVDASTDLLSRKRRR